MVFLITYIYINRYFSRTQNYYQKLIPKVTLSKYYRNVIEIYFVYNKVHNYFKKLFIKLLPKILPEICSPKLVPETTPEQLSTTPKLVPNIIPKNIPEINFPKLFKIIIKNYYPKFLKNTYPKIIVF